MSNYLLKYKGKYRILCDIDKTTNDFPRDEYGNYCDNDCYIACSFGNRIYHYGHSNLVAYIPSVLRGRNIVKALKEKSIDYTNYEETDEEVSFMFKAKHIDIVAELLKARTSGASISPFSSKNLPKTKFDLPTDELQRYKDITSKVDKKDLLKIHHTTTAFLEKKIKNYKTEMRLMMMGRLTKEYIYVKGLWEDYLKYLEKELFK